MLADLRMRHEGSQMCGGMQAQEYGQDYSFQPSASHTAAVPPASSADYAPSTTAHMGMNGYHEPANAAITTYNPDSAAEAEELLQVPPEN